MSKRNRRPYIFIIVVVLLAFSFGYLSYSLFWNGATEYNSSNSLVSVIEKVLIAQKSGENANLTSQDMNGIIDNIIDKGIQIKGIIIDDIYCNINNDEIIFYAPISYKNMDLLLSSRGKLSYNNNTIVFIPSSFYIGKLPLPRKEVMSNLRRYSRNGISIYEDRIEIDKKLVPFTITSMEVKEDVVSIGVGKLLKLSDIIKDSTGGTLESDNNVILLKDTREQLEKVYKMVNTDKEKEIISDIKRVINNLIERQEYSYKSDVNNIKKKYSQLSLEEKLDIGKAITTNMKSDVIGYIKKVFGI